MAPAGRIILTRSREQNRPWQDALERAGAVVVSIPAIRFTTLDPPADLDTADYDWILFTSPQGVRAFFEAGLAPADAKLGVLGAGTAEALLRQGYRDHLDVRLRDGSELARAFIDHVDAPASVLLPGAETRMPDPAATLIQAGHRVREVPLYRTEATPAREMGDVAPGPDDTVFFASPSAVRAFHDAFGVTGRCVAIGETTAITTRRFGYPTLVADQPNLESMAATLGLTLDTETEK